MVTWEQKMKDNTVKNIADKLNISKSTVSKAIRHCSGVDSETRQLILTESRRVNYIPHSNCDIYTILPENPQYFWSELRKGLSLCARENHSSVKCNIYTNSRDEDTVLAYLEEAEKLNARVVILATYITDSIQDKLNNMSDGRFIILLSEYYKLKNCFYVGADSYGDGYTMGKQYLRHHFTRKLVVFSIVNNINAQNRLAGFCNAIKEVDSRLLDDACFIPLESTIFKEKKLLPSKLAILLEDVARENDSLCLYTPFGISQLPLVMTKSKLAKKAKVLCHDCHIEQPINFMISLNQDLYEQGKSAMRLAVNFVKNYMYPEQKEIFVPSILNIPNN